MRSLLSALLLCGAALAAAGPASAKPLPPECDTNTTQAEMNICSAARWQQADAELNRLYKLQMAWLSPESKERLREAQRAWVVYRDKTCAYEAGPRDEGGTMWPLVNATCLEAMTKQRNLVLQSYVECRKSGCMN